MSVNLDSVTQADANHLESAEHKALGFRPPSDSLAAQAQSAAATTSTTDNDDNSMSVDKNILDKAAITDAARIAEQRGETVDNSSSTTTTTIDVTSLSKEDASKLQSAEHKLLGHRPPADSLAAQAQSAAAADSDSDSPSSSPKTTISTLSSTASASTAPTTLSTAAATHAAVVVASASTSPTMVAEALTGIKVDTLSPADARTLMSEEHKALGYRPPPGSLASAAQSAVAAKKASPPASPPLGVSANGNAAGKGRKNSSGEESVNTLPIEMLKTAARKDAERIEAERKKKAEVVGDVLGEGTIAGVPLDRIGEAEARALMSAEHKALGYRPPHGSLAATVQAAAAKHPHVEPSPEEKRRLEEAVKKDAERIAAERSGGARVALSA